MAGRGHVHPLATPRRMTSTSSTELQQDRSYGGHFTEAAGRKCPCLPGSPDQDMSAAEGTSEFALATSS